MRGNGNDDEKRIISLVSDLERLSERRYEPCYSDFLSESEQFIARRELDFSGRRDFMMWGGYEEAQRAVLCVYPEYSRPQTEDFPFEAVNLSFRRSSSLTHRDFLGALMSIGIKREAVGDIVIGEGVATFFLKKELLPYVSGQIEKIGREGVTFCGKGVDLDAVSQQYEEKSGTVSSLRLDAVICECANLSRSKAQQAVRSGLAAVNSRLVFDSDHKIGDGDKISLRGFGKFIVRCDGSLSKKGKYRITVLKYK